MSVARVVKDEIEDDRDAPPMRVGGESIEVLEGAEQRIDRGMIDDVVAEVQAGRGVDRREPDCVDAKRLDVVEMGGDPGQVADAVCVAVGEAPRVDLVDDPALPPILEWRAYNPL